MKDSRKIELFNNLFNYIVKMDEENATDILFNLGMTTNEIDDCAGLEYRENDDEENESDIVRVDIVDNEPEHPDERIMDTFYLANPDVALLEELQKRISARYDEEDGENYIEDYTEIIDFINEHFETVNIETKEIEW